MVGNLLVNAVKYGSPEAPVRMNVVGREHEVMIDVVNQGSPDDPQALSNLFEPLWRGERTGPIEHGSLGLGLFIAREGRARTGVPSKRGAMRPRPVLSVRLPRWH